MSDPAGNLTKLLWLLEVVGLLSRTGRARVEDADLVHRMSVRAEVGGPASESAGEKTGQEPQVTPPPQEAPKGDASARSENSRMRAAALRAAAQDPKTLSAAIRADHKRRMGKTYYEFLDVGADSSPTAIQTVCSRLLRRWQGASRNKALPSDVRALADELAKGCALVARTLGDPARKQEYDRRMARGQAPKLEGIRGARAEAIRSTNPRGRHPDSTAPQTDPHLRAVPTGSDEHAKARELLARSDFDAAVPLLQRARRKAPSDPGVLAELGWAVYKAQGKAHNPAEADEFLRLAMTFDPQHAAGLEYLARIAVDGKDQELAARRLRKLLGANPNHRWARRAVAKLSDGSGQDKSGARRFGFWKKE
jgi:tetratricopeptide (TPR) repeat protein